MRCFDVIGTEKLRTKKHLSYGHLGYHPVCDRIAVPASADARRYHAGPHWRQGGPDVIVGDGLRRRLGDGQRRYFGQRRRYFGVEPGLDFDVGPNSYECHGYDCNW